MATARIRNPDWETDEELKGDIHKYVMQNLRRQEVLYFLERDYPQYAWSLPTLSILRMWKFGIEYVDYNINVDDVKKVVEAEIDGPGKLLGYRLIQRKVHDQHGLAVSRGLVYDVMTDVNPEDLQGRGNLGHSKRRGEDKLEDYLQW